MPAPKGNKFAVGNEGGQPTKYRSKYCKEIINFFSEDPNRQEVSARMTGKNDFEKEEYKLVANKLPTLSKFARKIGVTVETLHNWTKSYDEFFVAFTHAKELYKEFIAENALNEVYDSRFAIFLAKNTTDWKDRTETDITTGGKPINVLPVSEFKELLDSYVESRTDVRGPKDSSSENNIPGGHPGVRPVLLQETPEDKDAAISQEDFSDLSK